MDTPITIDRPTPEPSHARAPIARRRVHPHGPRSVQGARGATRPSTADRRLLVVFDDVERSAHVVSAAVAQAEREAASLVVVHVMPQHVYEDRQRSRATIPALRYDGFTFTLEQATESARTVAERAARVAIGDRDVPYIPVGLVGTGDATIFGVAAAYGCDTILLAESPPWWRRHGRGHHTLAKLYDGAIVTVPRPPKPNRRTPRPPPAA